MKVTTEKTDISLDLYLKRKYKSINGQNTSFFKINSEFYHLTTDSYRYSYLEALNISYGGLLSLDLLNLTSEVDLYLYKVKKLRLFKGRELPELDLSGEYFKEYKYLLGATYKDLDIRGPNIGRLNRNSEWVCFDPFFMRNIYRLKELYIKA